MTMKTAALLVSLLLSTPAWAISWVQDYESLVGQNTGFIYAYATHGANSSHANQVGVGVGGSAGKIGTIDFLGTGNGFSGWGVGDNFGSFLGQLSTNLADFTATADIRVVASTWSNINNPPHSDYSLTVQFQAADDSITVDADTDPDKALEVRFGNYGSTDAFTTRGGLLSTGTVTAGAAANLPLAHQVVYILEWNKGNVAPNACGEDLGNQIVIDNLSLTMVPEVSTSALLAGLAATTLLLRRRR